MNYFKFLDFHGLLIRKIPNNKIKLLKEKRVYLF